MNAQEEDRQKTSCSGRGFGLAAVAVGVGVGAALYYIFNKRPENPHTEGSTSEWNCERSPTLSENSCTTILENGITSSGVNQPTAGASQTSNNVINIDTSDNDKSCSDSDKSCSDSDSDTSDCDTDISTSAVDSDTVLVSDSDVTTSVTDILTRFHTSLVTAINNLVGTKPAVTRNRERSWTLEECSICFEVMLRGEEVMALPCTHNFHTHCILPWLQEKQTCPNCRKTAQ